VVIEARASRAGIVETIAPRALGRGVVELGGGRKVMGGPIDPAVGFLLRVAPGDRVQAGDPLGEVHARDARAAETGRAVLEQAIVVGERTPRLRRLVSHRVRGAGVEPL
jgi:thymidine phosphorylase